ncbi:hypothetical protein BOTBODRAFT_32421 [Botryobasidium botryosum FD-172 SS1]|uniref:Uncharacterized protein n=1 Tax=Botryobasidium botryosum (strain FD-172 SS1) TaxID=930990 RepID=A0A067MIW3_BOTB1|nr:hypothetical protein BOTBODRAFT_32421 [Botryobasidium botryosum FD-172 SS1]
MSQASHSTEPKASPGPRTSATPSAHRLKCGCTPESHVLTPKDLDERYAGPSRLAEIAESVWGEFYTDKEANYDRTCTHQPNCFEYSSRRERIEKALYHIRAHQADTPLDFVVDGVRPHAMEDLYRDDYLALLRVKFPNFLPNIIFLAKVYDGDDCRREDTTPMVEDEEDASESLSSLWGKSIPRLFCPILSNMRKREWFENGMLKTEAFRSWSMDPGLLLEDLPGAKLLFCMNEVDFALVPPAAIREAAEASLQAVHERGWIVGSVAPQYILVGMAKQDEQEDEDLNEHRDWHEQGENGHEDGSEETEDGDYGREDGSVSEDDEGNDGDGEGDSQGVVGGGGGEGVASEASSNAVRVLFMDLSKARKAIKADRESEMQDLQKILDAIPSFVHTSP